MNPSHQHKIYRRVTWALLGLLVLTVVAAYVPLGPFGTPLAILIALAKASLILVFFMHLRGASGLVRLAALAGFYWLGILIVLALSDYLSRG